MAGSEQLERGVAYMGQARLETGPLSRFRGQISSVLFMETMGSGGPTPFFKERPWAILVVGDTGEGMPQDLFNHRLSRPFQTSKAIPAWGLSRRSRVNGPSRWAAGSLPRAPRARAPALPCVRRYSLCCRRRRSRNRFWRTRAFIAQVAHYRPVGAPVRPKAGGPAPRALGQLLAVRPHHIWACSRSAA